MRTHAVLGTDRKGNYVVRTETESVEVREGATVAEAGWLAAPPRTAVTTVETRTASGRSTVAARRPELRPRDDVGPVLVPRLRMSTIRSRFSLGDLTDMRPFRELGREDCCGPSSGSYAGRCSPPGVLWVPMVCRGFELFAEELPTPSRLPPTSCLWISCGPT